MSSSSPLTQLMYGVPPEAMQIDRPTIYRYLSMFIGFYGIALFVGPDGAYFGFPVIVLILLAFLPIIKKIRGKMTTYTPTKTAKLQRMLPITLEGQNPDAIRALLGCGALEYADAVFGSAANRPAISSESPPGSFCAALTADAIVILVDTSDHGWMWLRIPYKKIEVINSDKLFLIVRTANHTVILRWLGWAWRYRRDFNARLFQLIDQKLAGISVKPRLANEVVAVEGFAPNSSFGGVPESRPPTGQRLTIDILPLVSG